MGRRQKQAWLAAVFVAIGAGALVAVAMIRTGDDTRPYVPGEQTAGIVSSLDREAGADAPVRFTNVAAEVGADILQFHGPRSVQLPEDMGSGAAFGDFDGDGDDDLALVGVAGPLAERATWASSPSSVRLLRNDGGHFVEITEAAGLDFHGIGMGATWADTDGDGDLDLLVTAYGDLRLYENRGARFAEITDAAGLARTGFNAGAAWADYDRDGDLDLYVCRYVEYDETGERKRKATSRGQTPVALNPSAWPPQANALYRNDGTGHFEDVTETSGVANAAGRSLQAIWSDLDDDGWPDLYVANDVSDNALFRNRHDGTFEDVSHPALVADYRGAMGLAVGDAGGDGQLDLFVTHWIAQENALYERMAPDGSGTLRFMDVADMVGLGQVALDYVGWGTSFVDLDLDGRLDLLVANGSTMQDHSAPPRLVPMRTLVFWNRGPDLGFREIGASTGTFFSERINGRGLAIADIDSDGDPDAVIVRHADRAVVLRNDTDTGHHFAKIRLVGEAANRFAIGARLRLHAGGAIQIREVRAGGSYLSQDSLTAFFGLGHTETIDRLEVRWPDGTDETIESVPIDREVVVTKGAGARLASPPPGVAATPRVPRDARAFWTRFGAGRDHMAKGQWVDAQRHLEAALALDPNHIGTLQQLGAALAEQADYAGAERIWKRLVAAHPEHPAGQLQLGALHLCPNEGAPWNPSEAADRFRRVFEINPEQTGPFTRFAEAALARGRDTEAREVLEKVTAANRMDATAHFLLGFLQHTAGDADSATKLLGRALDAAAGPAPPRGASEEGDTRVQVTSAFAKCRPFARPLAELYTRIGPSAPSPADAEAVWAAVRAERAALTRRGSSEP